MSTLHTVAAGTALVRYDRHDPTAGATGPALVLVHGTGSSGAELTWGELVPRLNAHRTVLTPDLSGTERTTDDGGPLSTGLLAAQLIAVIEDAGTGPVDLLGFSMGAAVAATTAALRPDLVRRLILAAGWAHTEGDEYLRNLFTVWRRIADHDAEAFGRLITLTGFSRGFLNGLGPAAVEQLVPNMPPTPGTLRHLELDLAMDIRALLPRITTPTLVVGFGQDATVPVEHSRALHAAIAGSAYAELDAGHVGFFERGAEFAELVGAFTAAR
ncbi:alpha/beta fold hydrolase [Kitasatospora sp. NPDC006697]|uniref:alpha/beta fold hydrolase n=1 Tax=Kitasatospora sp. NPDC006697 TaxID=3364020 RepID=UPI003698347A